MLITTRRDEDSDGRGGHTRVMEQNTNYASNDLWQ